jgi:hypothetical protein
MATTLTHDVLPLFRHSDINCMRQRGVLLGDANWMCDPAGSDAFPDHAHARAVHDRLFDQTMPPDGGWSADKIKIYENWMIDGFQK